MRENPLAFIWADLRQALPYRRCLDLSDRRRRLLAAGFALLTLVLGFFYLVWIGRLVLQSHAFQDFLF